MSLSTIKAPNADRSSYVARVLLAAVIILLILGVVATRYYQLQVVLHSKYQLQSEDNRIRVRPVVPNRGLIVDQAGRVLAENWPSYTLAVLREQVDDDDIDQLISDLRQRVSISDEQVARFSKLLRRSRPYNTVMLKPNLTDAEIARIAVDSHLLNGAVIDAVPLRHYTYGDIFAHSVGYVGRLSESDLAQVDQKNYASTRFYGKTGIERFYESVLHGTIGYEHVEANASGRVLRVLESKAAIHGANLGLYLDAELQQTAYNAMAGRRGSVVAIEPATGGVLTLLSTPAFEPNLFVQGISNTAYNRLNSSLDLPLFNRSVLGQYPPGSTLKPLIGLAGLEYGVVDSETRINDPGWFKLPDDERLHRDWKREGHGDSVNLYQAIVESCDTYYYELVYRLGIDPMHAFLTLFGLGQPTGIDMIGERGGLLPSSEWKWRTKNLPWFPGETLNAGIGQGYMLATPLQLAAATATIANKGVFIQPRLLKTINGEPAAGGKQTRFSLRDETYWQTVATGMRDVVHSLQGTAFSISGGINYTMAGKTGTAQVVGIAQDAEYDSEALQERHRDHALFVAYAPLAAPKIAVAVIIENGESSAAAARVARTVIDTWLAASVNNNGAKP